MVTVFVPRERRPGERRVAATPETVKRLVKEGMQVLVEGGAGHGCHLEDEGYRNAGARIVGGGAEDWGAADLILKVGPIAHNELVGGTEAGAVRAGAVVVGLLAPHKSADALAKLAERGASALAMELVPRISRAQKMDALSSQASIAGYKAVLLAAGSLGKYFPLLMTAAGTVQPAKVVVMGAGVAGLQAVATARRLGATVEVSDIRPAVKEQVESLGARFIDLPMPESGEGQGGYAKEVTESFLRQQQEILSAKIAAADVVITTALVPGRPAPRLVTAEMVSRMRPGAVIVDLAVEQGGNCELSVAGEDVVRSGVRIIGQENLAATLPEDASMLYARNVAEVASLVAKGGAIDLSDEIARAMLVTRGGEVRCDAGRPQDRIA
ncbi:Re/Si-specific NAD(P)(+) transhydrogenase subunit alpha [Vulgatibacter incomptus]|uniref:NAD(P) transhydrogenase subunit alpha part 1 n=1 Tax=Vulgatibacter incomptus TaxID=1391653 RepID=A0A0K1PEP2_9BACT|nr:Re/Si-specific NAD(P)(+) transhydrogenase subunit alpha [Vulgatibacter incomptus]AKU91881.1 NAD(P) transhydrogenase alpha subunit [Vulgatibacter incomptus]